MDQQAVDSPPPTRRDILTRITPETAQRFAELRAQAKAKREAEAQAKEQAAQERAKLPDQILASRANEYDEQLTRLKAMLRETTDPLDIGRLSKAIATLEEVYCRYAVIPGPGNLKPSTARRPRSQPGFSPIEPENTG